MKRSRYAWLVVAMLWLVFLLNYLDRQVIFSLFPLLRTGLRQQDYQLGLIPTAFLWVCAACSPMGGFLGGRFGRKRIIILSLILWSLMSAAIGEARSLALSSAIVMLRGFGGVSGGTISLDYKFPQSSFPACSLDEDLTRPSRHINPVRRRPRARRTQVLPQACSFRIRVARWTRRA